MGARHHRELEAWQLADQVRRAILELVSREHVKRDYEFGGQARRAANSACRNTAEGFWRFAHPEFAHFVNIAKGSLGELIDSTDEALEKRYIRKPEYDALNELLLRAIGANSGLLEYLQTTPTPPRRRRKADRPVPRPATSPAPNAPSTEPGQAHDRPEPDPDPPEPGT